MTEFTIKEYPPNKYKADMETLLSEKGLHDAVKDYCDMIAEEAVGLGYIGYSSVTEWLCDILYLAELAEKESKMDNEVKICIEKLAKALDDYMDDKETATQMEEAIRMAIYLLEEEE